MIIDFGSFNTLLGLASGVVAAFATLVTGIWAYTKHILEKSLYPPVQFYIECKNVGQQGDKMILEVVLHLNNLGTSALVEHNLSVNMRYLDATDKVEIFEEPKDPKFGRLKFPHSLNVIQKEKQPWWKDPKYQKKKEDFDITGIKLLPYDTFVQPKVDQVYTFVTTAPQSATYVLVHSEFWYAQKPKPSQQFIIYLCRRLGLIHYSLHHVTKPHTAERVFKVG